MTASTVPMLADAVARRLVRLPDGRTARLVSVPRRAGRGSTAPTSTAARVRLPSGAYLSVPLADLSLVPQEDTP